MCWVLVKLVFRLRSEGAEHIPNEGSVLVVCNHQSNLDPILLAAGSNRKLRFLARSSLFIGPFGWLIQSLGAIPLSRDGSVLEGIRTSLTVLSNEEALLVFPEGKRTYDGSMQELKEGFCSLARRKKCPIIPAAIAGAFDAWPRNKRFPKQTRVALYFDSPITPEEINGLPDEAIMDIVRERITNCLERAEELR